MLIMFLLLIFINLRLLANISLKEHGIIFQRNYEIFLLNGLESAFLFFKLFSLIVRIFILM